MNPILSAALGSILRWALAFGAGWLVQHGIWTQADASTYVAAAAMGLLAFGLSLWNKYKGRVTLLTALTMPAGTTEDAVHAKMASGVPLPTITTPSSTVPGVPLAILLLLLLPAALAGCRPPTTITTPQGQVAYKADQVAVRVNELMNAAIQANATGGLPVATTRTIVTWCVTADQTLHATPAGWQATLKASWQATKRTIPTPTNPAIVAAMGAVDLVLGAL